MNIENKIPVLVLAFNRPDFVIRSMEPIKRYKPSRLYLECDGPRNWKHGEREKIKRCRRLLLDAVDWECEVRTLFREKNLGCAQAVHDAINWFFQNEDYGIIIEDDVIVGDDFFYLCEELLPRYIGEEKVMEISARNESGRNDIDNTYVYAQCYHCWGWATWKRAWQKMDMSMSFAPKLSVLYLVSRLGLFRGIMMKYYFMSAYTHLDTFNSWATRWFLSILASDGLVICPGNNLAINIGMKDGVHYSTGDWDPFENLKIGQLCKPILFNDSFVIDKRQLAYDRKIFLKLRMKGLKAKLSHGN